MTEESGAERFDKFTERARRMLQHGQETAFKFKHPYIDTSHLFVGVLMERDPEIADTFSSFGITPDAANSVLETLQPKGEEILESEFLGLTKDGKEAIALSVNSANEYGDRYIGPIHLAKGVLRIQEGTAIKIIESFGITQEQILAALDKSKRAAQQKPEPTPLPDRETQYVAKLHQLLENRPVDKEQILDYLESTLIFVEDITNFHEGHRVRYGHV